MIQDALGQITWFPSEKAWFEYHCWENPSSADAALWYRSHQPVIVLGQDLNCDGWEPDCENISRAELGISRMYRVQFKDGMIFSVFEDELLLSPSEYQRPDPPMPPNYRERSNP